MRTQHARQHPSDRLSSGTVRDFEEALDLVEDQIRYERALVPAPERLRDEAMDRQMLAATRRVTLIYRNEQEAARLRTVDRLRADALAAEAAGDDEAARWLGLLAQALERGDYSGLAMSGTQG